MKARGWVVLAAAAGVAAGLACGGKPPVTTAAAPPAVAPHVGKFVWHDLVTRDAAACRKFYGELLGWTFDETTREGRSYSIARSSGSPTAGIVQRTQSYDGPAAWLGYLSVPDLDRAVAQVTAGGGKVLLQPRPASHYGRIAVVTDPQGAPLGLAGITEEIPADPAEPQSNRFFWMEYLAKDAPSALAFYKDLAGYESSVTATQNGIDYHVLKARKARAALLQIPADATTIRPNWLPYVRVADPAALAVKAASLGGSVLVAPRAELRNGTLAVVADPTGGAIALQKWPL